MAVCFFNNDYKSKYSCEYEIKKNGIEVRIDYDIDDEIEPDSNGIKSYGVNTKFDKRDILIIDYKNKANYLLKDANYNGHSEVFGTPDDSYRTKFFSNCYFIDNNYNKLSNLKPNPKIKKIKIYSDIINEFIGHPSLSEESSDDEFIIKLKRDTIKQNILIEKNNIKSLIISDDWDYTHSFKNNDIQIKLNGYVEIEVSKRINYYDAYDYIRELMVYIQLLRPDKMTINKISVCIDEIYYDYFLPIREIKYNDSYVAKSVDDNFLTYLSKCYELIPFRNSKTEVRNIPYIIFDTSRNLEDNFLTFYRFIECYYKKQKIKGIVNNFVFYSFENNYKRSKTMAKCEKEKLCQEIISLRNHYIHSGYYIKNHSIKIKFKKVGKQVNPKNYTANNVDFKWIYKRTKILYDIVIDIIFRNMLEIEDYNFKRHF